MQNSKNRREFLKFISTHSAALGLSPLLLNSVTGCSTAPDKALFKGIKKTQKDALVLAEGLNYKIISRWGDKLNHKDDTFGFNNDFTCFVPFKNKLNEGLLWVNHESVQPEFIHNKNTDQITGSKQEMLKEQEAVGGSIVHIKKENSQWNVIYNSKYNRRLSARTPIPFSHGYKIQGSKTAIGTLSNCSGGLTPWNTILTSEENFDNAYGDTQLIKGKRTFKKPKKHGYWGYWRKHFPHPPEHYGWIVEVDPLTGKAEKQVLLGRAPHEGATVVETKNNRLAVYMGEDREFGYIYKFVSDGSDLKRELSMPQTLSMENGFPLILKKVQNSKQTLKPN